MRFQDTDLHIFTGLNIKMPHKTNRAVLKDESDLYSSQSAETSHLFQGKLKLLIVQAYQFRPGEWQSDRGSPPATTNKLAAHLLHQHIKKQHRQSKHSCTSKPQHVQPEPGSGVRLEGGMVPTCNIKDRGLGAQPPSLQASVRVQLQPACYPPPIP